jgi:hypothetical protein
LRIAQALVSGCFVAALAGACAQFSSGQCTDKALCDPNEASTNDTTTDAPSVDVNIDTVVAPDVVPDGECNGGIEDCANGKDDNCNGLVDCADPVCQGAGYACTTAAPSGWNGPVAFFSAAGSNVPPCGGAYATQATSGHDGISASPATCGCACGNPANVQCNMVGVYYYSDACVTQTGGDALPANNFCVNGGGVSTTNVKGAAEPTGYNGDCTATPSKNVPAVTWSNSYATCNYDAKTDTGGCTGGSLCVQAPPKGAWQKPCVWANGDIACPGSPYTQKGLFYTGVTDNRSCATCTCTATAGTCTGTITVYTGVGCTGGSIQIQTDGTCHTFAAGYSAEIQTITTTPGTCGNNGTGGPTGSASVASPVTVCCAP